MAGGGASAGDAGSLETRRTWLFPPGRGSWRGTDLDALDPSDTDDRAILVRAEHPEIDEDDDSMDALVGRAGKSVATWTPRLHLGVHEIVATQIFEGDPPEVGETADRLRALGYERHEILHMLGSVAAVEVWRAMDEEDPLDAAERARLLDELPGSWEATREGAGSHDAGFDEDDVLLARAHRLLAERGPLPYDEVCEELTVDEEEAEVLLADPALVFVSGGRVACAHAVLDGTTLTHRVSGAEATRRVLEGGADMAPLEGVACGEGHLHLASGGTVDIDDASDGGLELSLDDLGLPALDEGAVIGVRVAAPIGELATVEPSVLAEVPAVTETLVDRLRAAFDRLGHGERMPVAPLQLCCELLLDAPAPTSAPLPPIGELLEAAGFEVREGYTAPADADWRGFQVVRALSKIASRRGLGVHDARALTTLVQAAELCAHDGPGARPSRQITERCGHLLSDSELAEAFAEAMAHEPATARSFLRLVRETGGRHHEGGLWFCESQVAGRVGDVEAAQACLRSAIAADPGHLPSLVDAAWYASDRGDAAEAVRLLERAQDWGQERLPMMQRLAAMGAPQPARVGRNDPCPCGSGRKYKQCCLARPAGVASLSLEDRVGWVWEKMRWWLERLGPMQEMLTLAEVLLGTWRPKGPTELAPLFDHAASLLFFVNGVVSTFIADRGPLLPVDEANLVSQWALASPSVHEVGDLREGHGFTLRDLRTGDVVSVRERLGSRSLRDGDLVFTYPVFDGSGHQIIGGVVPVTLSQRGPLLDLLDGGDGYQIADELARSRRAPSLVNTEDEPTVLCTGTYRLADPAAAADRLDEVLEHSEPRHWVQMVEIKGQQMVRATVSLDADVLTIFANSEVRFERIKQTVTDALGPLDVLEETREQAADALDRWRAEGGEPAGGEPLDLSSPEVAAALERYVREREVA